MLADSRSIRVNLRIEQRPDVFTNQMRFKINSFGEEVTYCLKRKPYQMMYVSICYYETVIPL